MHARSVFLFLIVLYSDTLLGAEIDFRRHIQPLLEAACVSCHNAERADGDLRLDSAQHMLKGGDQGPAVVAGMPGESLLLRLIALPEDDVERMPPEDSAPFSDEQIAVFEKWIEQGAFWPKDLKLKQRRRIDFVTQVQPILETRCVSCHRGDEPDGGFSLETRALAFSSGDSGEAISPFAPEDSSLYTLTILERFDSSLMPPVSAGGRMEKSQTDLLKQWIEQGAIWPEDVKLTPRARPAAEMASPDDFALVERIHAQIVERSKQENQEAQFADYSSLVPVTQAKYSMVAVEGGEFLMGSPPNEEYRQEDEGPQKQVQVDPFWIGKYEVTWNEYEPFMITQVDRNKDGSRKDYDAKIHKVFDAVSQPTPPYTEMSFGMGQTGYPAISMTHHAANKYCQWLSAQTGHFYRLPTEAEWEYACRAGSQTAYSFGDDEDQLTQYGWFYDNSNEKYQKVGLKKPNAWGIHDMHGNVMEWTADQYSPDYFTKLADPAINPLMKPTTLYPRTVRGGGWDDDPDRLRSAARRGSDASWKQQDPQLPKSVWYHTNAQQLGFRIVRPKKIPTPEEMYFYWNSAKDVY